jgi:HD-GYP domain-containing protein (c-di-GMP phosphodiesterase class II)
VQIRDTLLVLEGLLESLTEASGSQPALRATVEATREGVGADLAFWHPKHGGKPIAWAGDAVMPAEQCSQFARKLLSAVPVDREIFRWANPEPALANHPTAALVARTPRAGGCVVALSFVAGRRFDTGDEEVARMALKMLAGIRAHAQTATKQLLNGLIHSLTTVLDAKDPYTAGHSERVARIAVLVGRQFGLSPPIVGDLFIAGILHDLGKIGTRDEVLWKPGKLTEEEYDEIKQHTQIGEKIVASIEPLRRLCPAVRHHHEHFDGRGYPDGLAGEAIPVLGRVLAVADAVDAMMSPRRYRPARSPLEIDAILTEESGKQFDGAIVAAFMAVRSQIYPPIYQKGIGESAYHAIESLVEDQTETTAPVARREES